MGISLLLNGWWRLGFASALIMATFSHAQTTPSAAPVASEATKPYPSAFDGYKPYTDEPIVNWKAANDTTASVGGWREYARQAQQPVNTPTSSVKPDQAMPAPGEKAKP
jgi:hypothetical protein